METRVCPKCGMSLPSGMTDVFCLSCAQFERQWASTVLDQARAKLRQECIAAGESELYARVSLAGDKIEISVPYAVLAKELGMSKGALKSAVSRLRRRYGELVRQEVAKTVSSPVEIEPEVRYLLKIIGA